MVLLRFPFWFPQPPSMRPNTPNNTYPSRGQIIAAATLCAAAGALAAASHQDLTKQKHHPIVQNAIDFLISKATKNHQHALPMWASLSLAAESDRSTSSFKEPRTGMEFPSVVGETKTKHLLGVGLRRKNILGLKNIDVYAFGVYADDDDIKKLASEKSGNQSIADGKGRHVIDDLMEADIQATVKLQIVYSKLSIRSVRSAFEESVGSRLQKFGGSENKDLLQRFTSQFKDEYKIPKGSVIDISRESGYVLCTSIDGQEIGSIQSKLLCRSILDLYIGEDPFDKKAKEDIELKLASLVHN